MRTMSGVTLSTIRVYFFTARVSSDALRSPPTGRSNNSMSFLRDRKSRSDGGHINTHVPVMCVVPGGCTTATSGRSAVNPSSSYTSPSSSSSPTSPTAAPAFSSGLGTCPGLLGGLALPRRPRPLRASPAFPVNRGGPPAASGLPSGLPTPLEGPGLPCGVPSITRRVVQTNDLRA